MRNTHGFTLLEVMISLLVFSLVMAGMGPAFIAQLHHNTESEIRTESIAAAQILLDQLRLESPSSLPTTGAGSPQEILVGTRTYTATAYFCETSTYCLTANNRHITVRVDYKDEQIFETQTVYTQLR